jgi:hypothetical protein
MLDLARWLCHHIGRGTIRMADRALFLDCDAKAPETEGGDTSFSTSSGWRLIRRTMADGSRTVEWRCPACWAKYRAKAMRSR